MDNASLARAFHQIADILEIQGENSFRIRSYRTAAESLANLGPSAAEMVQRGESLRSIPGVGEGIASKVKELVETGSCAYLRELLEVVPESLLELLHIPGLGPKGVALVWQKLGVTSAADLEAAIDDGRLRGLPGMKEKKEAKIKKGLADLKGSGARILLPEAEVIVEKLTTYLIAHGAQRVEPVGSYRRRRESVGDLDLIVVGDGDALSQAFVSHPDV
jgi:DNA polymerase (family 10)